ncbi:MAG: hypothetical protein HYZ34_01600 [Ignavibacteriae bacterium]|nr:hypothetical protein [Ignavibacteriota bacterium]
MSPYKSKLFQQNFQWNEFTKDLGLLLSLGEKGLDSLSNFLNQFKVKEKVDSYAYIKETFNKNKDEVKAIQNVISFLISQYGEEPTEEFDLFLEDMAQVARYDSKQLELIQIFFKKIKPFIQKLDDDSKYENSKSRYDYELVSWGTNCKVKLHFSEDFDFETNPEEYNAESDIKDTIPLIDIYMKIKHKKDEKEFIFQVDENDIDNIIKSLTLAKKQLKAVQKIVLINRNN